MVDFVDDLHDPLTAFLPQFIPEIRLLLIGLQQILPEDLLRQIRLDSFNLLGGEVGFIGIDRVGHHMDMRMIAGIVKCGIPVEVLRGYFHLLGNLIPLGAKQVHPRIRGVIAQPFRIFPAEGDDVRPDVTGVIVHFVLHLGQHDGYPLVREQTITTGALINIFQIYIPLRSIAVQFQNAIDERIRIAAGRIICVIPVLVTVLAVRVLFQQPCDLLLLFCGGRQMAGGIFRHLHTFPGGDILEVATGRLFVTGFQIGGFQNQSRHPLSPFLKFYRILEAVFTTDGSNFVGAEPAESG